MRRDKETFIKVLEQHKRIVFKVCNLYVQQPEDREDLVQEVILQLWRSFDSYREEYQLSTWVYRIALNVAVSNLRKSSTRRKYLSTQEESLVLIAPQEEPREEVQLLHHFISELDKLNKALIMLHLEGYQHAEIAEMLHISKSNVGTKLLRIKKQLKEKFAHHGNERS